MPKHPLHSAHLETGRRDGELITTKALFHTRGTHNFTPLPCLFYEKKSNSLHPAGHCRLFT